MTKGCPFSWIAFFLIWLINFQLVSGQTNETYQSGEKGLINFYQSFISPADGKTCGMHPSCSQYAKILLSEDKGLSSYLSISDRLLRCGHDLDNYTRVKAEDYFLYYDPVYSDKVPYLKPGDIDKILAITLDNRYPFPDSLFRMEEYHLANLEYNRLKISLSQKDFHLDVRIAYCHYMLNNEVVLKRIYNENLLSKGNEILTSELNLLLAQLKFKNGGYSESLNLLKSFETPYNASKRLFLKGLCEAYLGLWEDCANTMNQITGTYSRYANQFNNLNSDVGNLELRSSKTAAFMSAVIPGTGYFISGHKQTALTSLLINSLFIYIALESFKNELYGIGTAACLFELGWYFGSIKGSMKAVDKTNQKKISNLILMKLN